MQTLIQFGCGLLLLSLSPLSQAEAYRCKTPQGTVVFQDKPCANGNKGEEIQLKSLPNASPGTTSNNASWRDREQQSIEQRQRKAEAEKKAAEAQAPQKAERCSRARRDLSILQQQVAAFRVNQQGERQYIDDKDRDTEIANMERVIRENCN